MNCFYCLNVKTVKEVFLMPYAVPSWMCHTWFQPAPLRVFSQPLPYEESRQSGMLSEPAASGFFILLDTTVQQTNSTDRFSVVSMSDGFVKKCVWPAVNHTGSCCTSEAVNWNFQVCAFWLTRQSFKQIHKGAMLARSTPQHTSVCVFAVPRVSRGLLCGVGLC